MNKKLLRSLEAALVGVSCAFSFIPAPAEASADIAGIFGSIVGGIQAYSELDNYIDTINNTDEGREQYYESMKNELGVADDPYHQAELDGIMANLTRGIGSTDPSIYQKPYLYFLNPSTDFNAACGLGHVMTVNEGLFSLCEDPNEVAFVLAHEMGHGQKDHVASGSKKKLRTIIGGSIASASMGSTELSNLAMSALIGQINNIQITKKQEWEADNLAFDYCYHAGYNPGAGAALWQRVYERQGEYQNSFVGEIFSPDDHPSDQERRDNYEKKLDKLSGNHISIKKNSNTIQVNKKDFMTPAAYGGMSSAERKYYILGNLAAAYDHKQNASPATVSGNTVYLGNQAIVTSESGDPTAQELADRLNQIK